MQKTLINRAFLACDVGAIEPRAQGLKILVWNNFAMKYLCFPPDGEI
jgi:hypothetical protein